MRMNATNLIVFGSKIGRKSTNKVYLLVLSFLNCNLPCSKAYSLQSYNFERIPIQDWHKPFERLLVGHYPGMKQTNQLKYRRNTALGTLFKLSWHVWNVPRSRLHRFKLAPWRLQPCILAYLKLIFRRSNLDRSAPFRGSTHNSYRHQVSQFLHSTSKIHTQFRHQPLAIFCVFNKEYCTMML